MAILAPVRDAIMAGVSQAADADHLDIAQWHGRPGLTMAVTPTVAWCFRTSGCSTARARPPRPREPDERRVPGGRRHAAVHQTWFDSVSCRFGFMFFPDLQGRGGVAPVLRRAVSSSTSVWAGPEADEWAVVPMMVIASVVDMTPPPPDAPVCSAAPSRASSRRSSTAGLDVSPRTSRGHRDGRARRAGLHVGG